MALRPPLLQEHLFLPENPVPFAVLWCDGNMWLSTTCLVLVHTYNTEEPSAQSFPRHTRRKCQGATRLSILQRIASNVHFKSHPGQTGYLHHSWRSSYGFSMKLLPDGSSKTKVKACSPLAHAISFNKKASIASAVWGSTFCTDKEPGLLWVTLNPKP